MRDTRHKTHRARCFECGAVLHRRERDYCAPCFARFQRLGLEPIDGPPADNPIGQAFRELKRAIAAAGSVEAFSLEAERGEAPTEPARLFATLADLRRIRA